MKGRYGKAFVFAGKSFVWAAALYSVCLVGLYKDDIENVVSAGRGFSVNLKAHTLPQITDTTVVPNVPHTGIFLSSTMGIRSIEVSVGGLLHIVSLFSK